MKRPFALIAVTAISLAQQPAAPLSIRGFAQKQLKGQHDLEGKAREIPESQRIGRYIQRMSEEPHHAGSPQSKAVAEYAAGLLKEWGYDVQIEEYEALLPYPTHRSLELTSPTRYRAKLREPSIKEDKDSIDRNQLPPFNAYSASGDVTGQLVYVNFGVPEDYEELKKLGVDVQGRIVIARYGKSWRGTKPKVAQEHGAIGCLIYSDPHEDGYFQGDFYPKGPFRPPQGAQRGSVMDMPVYVGDPLSPGWASEPGSKRLSREEAKTLMKIPVLPISYEDAQPLLAHITGPVAPAEWRGALPITYHVGPGPSTVRLRLDFDWTTKPMFNVIATMSGDTAPEEWVIYGNHHDAWVNGAHDPVSGAASLLETARALAMVSKDGWRPRRTIKFALWDGEEFGLLGSTEWVEKHADELNAKAVAYFNSDSNARGRLGVSGSGQLQTFLSEVMRDVQDPVTKKNYLSDITSRAAGNQFRMEALGAGSDYVAFSHHVGIPGLNLAFTGPDSFGVYHSIYDSYHRYAKFTDPGFVYGRALSQIMVTALLRMADARIVPVDFTVFTDLVNGYVDEIKKHRNGAKADFADLQTEIGRLRMASKDYEDALKRGGWTDEDRINLVLRRADRALAAERGLPQRSWYKNVIAAPGLYTGYSVKTLPAVREAVEAGRIEEANEQANIVAGALRAMRAQIVEAAKLLRK